MKKVEDLDLSAANLWGLGKGFSLLILVCLAILVWTIVMVIWGESSTRYLIASVGPILICSPRLWQIYREHKRRNKL